MLCGSDPSSSKQKSPGCRRPSTTRDKGQRASRASTDRCACERLGIDQTPTAGSLQDDDVEPDQRQRIEATLRRTDELVAEKDQELNSVRQQMAELMSSRGSGGSPRPRTSTWPCCWTTMNWSWRNGNDCSSLQVEWHNKQRQAEVECSKERAQIARLRSELQEKIRDVEAQLARTNGNKPDGKSRKSGRRWLDHLGLKSDDK